MKSKAGITMIVALAVAAVAVAAAAARTDTIARPTAANMATSSTAAAAKCGKTMYIGVAAPITGAASSIGVQQLHWAQFAVNQWNKSGAKPKLVRFPAGR